MRREEICQLSPRDVRKEQDVWFFDIHEREDNSVKTDTSTRWVPIHKEVLEAGFLDYVKARANNERLFDVSPNQRGFLGDAVGKRFSRRLDRLKIEGSFHSLRHTFKTACRRALISEDIHDRLTGHSNGSVGRTYGSFEILQTLKASIDKVNFKN
jgi:integrase